MPKTSYTNALTASQAEELRPILRANGFEFVEKEWTIYAARKGKLNVAVYEKGPKILVQGKETEDFVQFILEPMILGVAELGNEEIVNPEMFEPHFGIDESGKGDFFGPLVIAGAYVDSEIARHWIDEGVQDSKAIKSDAKIRRLAAIIRRTKGAVWEVVSIGPAKYNELYEKFQNLNRLLAWGHVKAIEELSKRRPECPRALSDQFANPKELETALARKKLEIQLQQRTKAESDVAVAAASILAREKLIDWLRAKSEELEFELPRGAGLKVQELTASLRKEHGFEFLRQIGKTHFRFANRLT